MGEQKLETKFGEANHAYRKYRPGYPKLLFEKIMEKVSSPYEKALDIGAGTGISTRILAGIFENVTAVEPDGNMVYAGDFGKNSTVIQECTENVKLEHGQFDLITAGNSFYWMEAESVLVQVRDWLKKDGILAAYRYNLPLTDNSQINHMICRESSEHWEEFRNERLKDTAYTYRSIKKSPYFEGVEISTVDNIVTLEPEEIIGFFASTSYGSAYIKTLDEPKAYLNELLRQIKQTAGTSGIHVDFGLELVIAIKK